jgi:hypothetical protein
MDGIGDPIVDFVLAMAQWRNGDRTEASRQFQQGLEDAQRFKQPTALRNLIWQEASAVLGKKPGPPAANDQGGSKR